LLELLDYIGYIRSRKREYPQSQNQNQNQSQNQNQNQSQNQNQNLLRRIRLILHLQTTPDAAKLSVKILPTPLNPAVGERVLPHIWIKNIGEYPESFDIDSWVDGVKMTGRTGFLLAGKTYEGKLNWGIRRNSAQCNVFMIKEMVSGATDSVNVCWS